MMETIVPEEIPLGFVTMEGVDGRLYNTTYLRHCVNENGVGKIVEREGDSSNERFDVVVKDGTQARLVVSELIRYLSPTWDLIGEGNIDSGGEKNKLMGKTRDGLDVELRYDCVHEDQFHTEGHLQKNHFHLKGGGKRGGQSENVAIDVRVYHGGGRDRGYLNTMQSLG